MAGRGGRRPGAGRKPLPRDDMGRVIPHPAFGGGVPAASVPELPPPADVDPSERLSPEARLVWDEQAPHALAARTLTGGQRVSFERYCQAVVDERTIEPRYGTDHRGLLRQINAWELQFLLTPCGKPIPAPVEAAKDEDADFFGDSRSA